MSEPHPGEQPAQPDGPPPSRKEGPADAGAAPPYPPAGTGGPGSAPQGYGQPPDQQGSPPAQGQPGYGQELSPADQRMWSILGHLGGILFAFLAPLVVYLVQKDRGQYVKEQSAEALNFQITILIGYVIVTVLTIITFGLGGILYLAVWIVSIVFAIMAGLASNKGENYRYPVTLRLIS